MDTVVVENECVTMPLFLVAAAKIHGQFGVRIVESVYAENVVFYASGNFHEPIKCPLLAWL